MRMENWPTAKRTSNLLFFLLLLTVPVDAGLRAAGEGAVGAARGAVGPRRVGAAVPEAGEESGEGEREGERERSRGGVGGNGGFHGRHVRACVHSFRVTVTR